MSGRSFYTDPELQSIVEILRNPTGSATAEEVSAAFKKASGLKQDARIYIADQLEEEISRTTGYNPEAIKSLIWEVTRQIEKLEDLRKRGLTQPVDTNTALSGTFARAATFIADNKGDKASLLIKLYMEERAKFSTPAWGLPENRLKAFCNALDMLVRWPKLQKQRLDEKAAQEKAASEREGQLVKTRLEKLKNRSPVKRILKGS